MSETDPTGIGELLSEEHWLRSLAGGLVRGRDRADEVVQETWLATIEHPPERRGTARGWLATVARNAARQLLRRERRIARRERGSARREAVPDVAEAVARVELRRRLAQEVLALDEPFRGAIVLRFFEGRSPVEIAEALGVPAATVRTRIHRGLASPPFSPGVRIVTRNGARLQRLRRQTDARIEDSVFSSRHRRSGLESRSYSCGAPKLRERLDRSYPGGRCAWGPALLPFAPKQVAPAAVSAGAAGGALIPGVLVMSAKLKLGLVVTLVLVLSGAVWRVSTGDREGPPSRLGHEGGRASRVGAPRGCRDRASGEER